MAEHPLSRVGNVPAEDALLKAALADVPLPAGLAARLKAHVRTQYQQAPSANAVAAAVAYDANDQPLSPNSAPHAAMADAAADVLPMSLMASSDRSMANDGAVDDRGAGWLRRSILIAAVAAGICGFAFLARQWSRPAEPSWLASHCDSILVEIEKDNPANWLPAKQPIPATLVRVRSQLVRVAIIAERPLAALGSKINGSVYRLDAGDGRGIYLMRLESLPAIRGLTSRFEILSTPSGGWSLAAMTVGKETFVLAAACTEREIFTYIRRADLT